MRDVRHRAKTGWSKRKEKGKNKRKQKEGEKERDKGGKEMKKQRNRVGRCFISRLCCAVGVKESHNEIKDIFNH